MLLSRAVVAGQHPEGRVWHRFFVRRCGGLDSEPHRLQVFNLVSPVVFLGGIAAAPLLNSVAIARLDLLWEQNRLGEYRHD